MAFAGSLEIGKGSILVSPFLLNMENMAEAFHVEQ